MKDYIGGYSQEEWEKVEKEFRRDFDNSKKYNKSFQEIVREILEGETYLSFEEKTGLSPNMFYRIKSQIDEKDPPQRNTLFSLCVGYNLDLLTAQTLLRSLGLEFNHCNTRDYAYNFLLTRCRGKDVDECNEILKGLGLDKKYFLGSFARKSKSK